MSSEANQSVGVATWECRMFAEAVSVYLSGIAPGDGYVLRMRLNDFRAAIDRADARHDPAEQTKKEAA